MEKRFSIGCILICAFLISALNYAEARDGCGPKKIKCVTSTSYQTCWWVLWVPQFSKEIYNCKEGTVCDEYKGDPKCIPIPTTPVPTTTTKATTTKPPTTTTVPTTTRATTTTTKSTTKLPTTTRATTTTTKSTTKPPTTTTKPTRPTKHTTTASTTTEHSPTDDNPWCWFPFFNFC